MQPKVLSKGTLCFHELLGNFTLGKGGVAMVAKPSGAYKQSGSRCWE